jgi:hypothetical protein
MARFDKKVAIVTGAARSTIRSVSKQDRPAATMDVPER